jgi:hypothetical protein
LGLCAAVTACGSDSSDKTDGGAGTGGAPSVILDGGGVIPDPPDGAASCQSGSCNYQKQDCPSGGSCLPTDTPPSGDWPPKCFVPGQKGAGEACSSWSDCIAGYFCVGIGSSEGGVVPGTCRKLCCGGDWSACPDGESCFQNVSLVPPGGGAPIEANADICAPVGGCDPLTPTSCSDTTRTCQIVDPTGNVACVKEGSGGQGAACKDAPCKGGFVCVDSDNGFTCRRLCKAVEGGGEPSCQSGEGICVHYNRDPANVGECTPTG